MTKPSISRRSAINAVRSLARRHQPTPEEARALAEDRVKEQDRSIAIVRVASLDAVLSYVIKRKFVNLSSDEEDALFQDGPLASFSAKIKIAYALGLYGPETRDDLNMLREIRNAFAHSTRSFDFTNPAIMQCCRMLKTSNRIKWPYPDNASINFSNTAAWTAVSILESAHDGDQSRVP